MTLSTFFAFVRSADVKSVLELIVTPAVSPQLCKYGGGGGEKQGEVRRYMRGGGCRLLFFRASGTTGLRIVTYSAPISVADLNLVNQRKVELS